MAVLGSVLASRGRGRWPTTEGHLVPTGCRLHRREVGGSGTAAARVAGVVFGAALATVARGAFVDGMDRVVVVAASVVRVIAPGAPPPVSTAVGVGMPRNLHGRIPPAIQ